MALRPFSFGVRLRDKGRTLRVREDPKRREYVVEDVREGCRAQRRSHASLGGAIRDAAVTWRGRLN